MAASISITSNHIHMHGGLDVVMTNVKSVTHAIVTPCRDHVEIFQLIDSMIEQTVPPLEWIIVLHNLKDYHFEQISIRTEPFQWIRLVRVNDDSTRKRGAQIARLVNAGISEIKQKWTYLSKIDADMVLELDYFENILGKFLQNQKLGIASGSCYLSINCKRQIEKVSDKHTRGGLKTYRRQCYEDIGGIREVDGWDGVDNIVAQMNGWETSNFSDIMALHTRRTGSHAGLLNGCFESGKFAYALRYSLLFMVARSLHRMLRKPVFLGGVSMFAGYLNAALLRTPQSLDDAETRYLRESQKERLMYWSRKSKKINE